MKTISKIKYALFLLVIVGFISCKGEIGPAGADGIDGTNGTNGTNGTDGDDGVNGTNGVDGEDGNANVISSAWITPTWSVTNSTYGEYGYTETRITEEFRNTGVILSYIDWTGEGQFAYALPMTSGYSNILFTINFGMSNVSSESIRWWFEAESNFTPNANAKLRYVMIPASTNKSANSKQEILEKLKNAGVDVSNYYEVMDYYGFDY